MFDVLSITAPLFTLMLFGYLAVKTCLLPCALLPGLARFVLYFCVPGVILSNFLRETQQPILDPNFLQLYAALGVLMLAIGFALSRLIGRPPSQASIFALGGAVPNSMFVGFPILLQVTPDIAVQVLVMCVLVENALIIPLALLVADASAASEGSVGQRVAAIAKRMVTNPMLVCVLVGLSLSSLDIYAPLFLQNTFDMLAKAAAPAALIFIGGALVGHKVRGDLSAIVLTSTLKLLIMPLLALILLHFGPQLDPQLAVALVLVGASPMLSIYAIIASNYGVAKQAASIQVFATSASFVSLNLFLAYLLG